jgi:hypothetical protein
MVGLGRAGGTLSLTRAIDNSALPIGYLSVSGPSATALLAAPAEPLDVPPPEHTACSRRAAVAHAVRRLVHPRRALFRVRGRLEWQACTGHA